MILLPEKYSDTDLTKDEKLLVSLMKNKLNDNNFILLKITPLGTIENNLILLKEGGCFLQTLDIDNTSILSMVPYFKTICEQQLNSLKLKLLTHRLFNDVNKVLNVAINYKYFVPSIKRKELDITGLQKEEAEFVSNHILFKDDITQLTRNIELLKASLIPQMILPLEGDRLNTFIHMVAPEYTIPVYTVEEQEKVKQIVKGQNEYTIEQNSLTVRSFRLEPEQINIVNNIKPGHQLMLACAGSGKSVLLIAKAFKVASKHQDENILITCYNKNLNDMYNWRINVAGFRERNVDCMTFHKLCRMLLNEVNVYYDVDDFDATFEIARAKLKDGTIKRRYFGIFIDEVQVFKPEWYEFCYDLLYSKDEKNYFFIICGDKSQNVASNVKQGKACWQGNSRLPNYRGKSIRLEKNYRNSDKINAFINDFTEVAKQYATKYNILLKDDIESILRGKSVRSGEEPQIIQTDRMNEAKKVLEYIRYLNEVKEVDLSDIAVLFGNRQYTYNYGGRKITYDIYKWVIKQLDDHYMTYSELSPPDSQSRVHYGFREGVSLCTIEGALGLDFKAVIMCGISPIGAYKRSKVEKNLQINDEEIQQEFLKGVNTLYTGCSRARDHLIIILNEGEEKSLYSKMLLEAKQ